jgi:hypothetical protein
MEDRGGRKSRSTARLARGRVLATFDGTPSKKPGAQAICGGVIE